MIFILKESQRRKDRRRKKPSARQDSNLDFMITRRVLYRCATTAAQYHMVTVVAQQWSAGLQTRSHQVRFLAQTEIFSTSVICATYLGRRLFFSRLFPLVLSLSFISCPQFASLTLIFFLPSSSLLNSNASCSKLTNGLCSLWLFTMSPISVGTLSGQNQYCQSPVEAGKNIRLFK